MERTFRPAREADLDRLIEIHTASYPDPRTSEQRRRNFCENPLGALSDLVVCLEGDRIVGHAFLFSLRVWLRGEPRPVGGIASIAVAPEARKTGVARDLLDRLHALSSARGDLLTLLHPFSQAFYARHGYAPVSPMERLCFSPQAVPGDWRKQVHPSASRAIEAIWTDVARASTGMLDRPRALWDRKHLDERRTTLATDGGYVAWEIVQETNGEMKLVVKELVAKTPEAMRTLMGAVGAQGDQVHACEIDLPRGHPLALVLARPPAGTQHAEDAIGAILPGPMIRLCSVDRALALVPAAKSIETDRATLGALLFGGMRLSDAIALGLAKGEADLAHPPYFSPDSF